MKILLYEWCCSGGLADAGAAGDFGAIVSEGRAMLEALAADAARDPTLEVTVLADPRLQLALPSPAHVRAVPPGGEIASLEAAARQADWTVIVAPETDGILRERVAAVRALGARALNASTAFIEIAADKQATAQALAAAGVPVPPGRSLAAHEGIPPGFRLPAVRKLRDGVGGDGFAVVTAADHAADPRPTRLEPFVEGIPVGVSCLGGSRGVAVLPPMRQRFSAGLPPRFLGGEPLEPAALAARATGLAARAIAAVARAAGEGVGAARGWLGVDMILGGRDDGRADRVLEVNPRLTTSFVGFAAAAPRSLVRGWIDAAEGRGA